MERLQTWLRAASPTALLVLAVVAGVGGAVGSVVFHWLLTSTTTIFYGDFGGDFVGAVEAMPLWERLLIPTLGGLLVGLVFRLTRVSEAEGEGVPEVVEALAIRHGTIRSVVAPVKIIAATLTLSSGGSAGREGPVIQIGSAIGSTIGQWARMADTERSLLLACGAAAAIGGTFGAPFAGVVFTIEILKHRPVFLRTSAITVSALVGAALTAWFTGHTGWQFTIGTLPGFVWWPSGLLAVVVGVGAALTALLFGLTLRAGKVVGSRMPVPALVRPAVGGFLVGVIALWLPQVHEPAAYPLMIDLVALAALPLTFLGALFLFKMIATGLTLGSGGVGGIFAPALLLGTILGSLLAGVFVSLGLIDAASAPLFVIVGMAAVFAGAAHAPITAALITYEMTGQSELIIPLLIACFVATYLARSLAARSIYEQAM